MQEGSINLKREIKDSIFSSLVKEKKYLREVYLSLYPEDKTIKEEDIKLIKLENVFVNGLYNDLSFKVRDKLIIFMECQSTWSPNIPLRLLSYFTQSFSRIEKGYKKNQYKNRKITIPLTKFYVLYTGERKNTPPYLYAFFEEDNDIMARVKVLDRDNTVGILKEICLFCELYDKNVDEYGRDEEAIKKTLKECEERKILSAFIKEHIDEVEEIMRNMSQEKRIKEFLDYSVKESRKEALEEGKIEGREEGRVEGREEEALRTIEKINRLSISPEIKEEILKALKTK